MLSLINPVRRAEPFDHPDWVFEVKFDGFRAAADTVRGQLISRNGNRMRRFEEVLSLLPPGLVLDGELVVLNDAGRPLFNKLLFGHRRPTYVAFDLLIADGVDLRPLPLSERKARLAQIAKRAEGWIALTNGVVGAGRALYRAVVDADLEGIVAKKLADPYIPELARWHKVLNRDLYEVARVKKFFRDQHSSLPTFQEGVHVSAVLH
jgi:bifunctional non-homologous end joining protein LigD